MTRRVVPVEKLGKYEILAELGHGAMGVVYQARDPFIGRLVALKTINSNLVDRPDLLERFYQEAQSAGKLQHPNIVTIFELGQEKDTPFIAMEYLDGESLEKTIVRQADFPLALKIGYIVRICQALEYAHKNRVVHRDIKPGNVMVNSEGVVKVVDFGIARLVDFSRTHTNMMIGTPAYMAPELFRKKKADERTDIWAVGITFYELLCYQRPFTGEGYDIIRAIMEDEFPPVSSVVAECGPELEAILQKMLRKQPVERYQSMEDVLLDLEPVWNEMRLSAAAELAERAREFYEIGDLPKAQVTLQRARQIDNSNVMAKSLFEKISAELRRTEIEPKVQKHLSRGRALLQAGQFREAQAEAEAALVLDSRHELAHKFAEEAEAGATRAERLEQKLRLTKQRLAEGALTEAETALGQALDLDGGNAQALELRRHIGEERARREKRKQLVELLNRARALWVELKYDECLAMIAEGLTNFPENAELKNLQESARADQREQKKQARVVEVRRLMGQQKLAEARAALDVLLREQPADSAIRNLQNLLTQEELDEKRKKRLLEPAPASPLPAANAPTVAATAFEQSATSIAGSGAGQRASVPVLTPPPAAPPQVQPPVRAPAATSAMQTPVRVAESAAKKIPKKPVGGGLSRKLAVAAVLAVAVAGGIYAAVRMVRGGAAKPSAEDLAIEAEAKQLWENHKPDDALADWKKLASHAGVFHDEASQQVSEIEQKHVAVEQLYAQGMKLLYEEKKYPEAAEKFNEVLRVNLWKMDETRREFEIASKGAGGTAAAASPTTPPATPAPTPGETAAAAPVKPVWQSLYENGQRAFNKKDYAGARHYMEQAQNADGVSKEVSDRAQKALLAIADREQQTKMISQAMDLEKSGQRQQAKELFERVVAAPNGDPSVVAVAQKEINLIGASPPAATANSSSNPLVSPNAPKAAPDYGTAVGEVRGLISQSRWDDADAKLNALPATLPEYGDLKQQIATGRADLAFSRVKTAFLEAEASKNKNALRNLRPYFMAEANKAGAHGGDARNIVNRIDADLREPDANGASSSGSTVVEPPHLGSIGAVKVALDNYARAIDNGDLNALRGVTRLSSNDEQKLAEQLNAIRGKGYTLQNCSVPEISGETAKVSCDVVMTRVPNAKRQRTKFQLELLKGRWIVVSAH